MSQQLAIRQLVARRKRNSAIRQILSWYCWRYLIKQPSHTSILKGAGWVEELLNGNPHRRKHVIRMDRVVFRLLVDKLVESGLLQPTRNVSSEEQVVMFLYFAGQRATNRQMQERFQHSGETITRHLYAVVRALVALASTYIKLPEADAAISCEISENPKFSPYFDNCRMAIDGTHLPVFVPANVAQRFRGRKGLTQNVLAACTFDLQFTYVLAGWEGTAGDGKLLENALVNDYRVDKGKFDLGDAGFALTPYMLTPYRGTRYHLHEWGQGTQKPQTKEELFNLRHASLRNCIERIFGVLKNRFPVLVAAMQYPYRFQVDIVIALCTVHNFIRLHGGRNDSFEQKALALDIQRSTIKNVSPCSAQASAEARAFRDEIAETMFKDYQSYLARH